MFKTTTPLQRLRESSYTLSELPESIRTGDVGEFSQPINKAINTATVDDIAFAIQSLSTESTALFRRLDALRQLHDRARRAGGLGADLAIESAMRVQEGSP